MPSQRPARARSRNRTRAGAAARTPPRPAQQTAARAEATGQPVTVEFRHLSFTVPGYNDLPLDVLDAVDAVDQMRMIRLILGPEQYQAFRDAAPTIGEYNDLAHALIDATGLGGPGN